MKDKTEPDTRIRRIYSLVDGKLIVREYGPIWVIKRPARRKEENDAQGGNGTE